MIHAGDTYEAMRLDALAKALRLALEAIGRSDRHFAIDALRNARNQADAAIAHWEAQQ